MKKIAVVLLTVLIAFPFLSDNTSGNEESLWLYEIAPSGTFEAVTVYNAGNAPINMKNYYLDDGEGTVRFTADLFIGAKKTITIASVTPEEWFTGRSVYVYGTNGITAKSFILADAGDEVMLKRASDNKILDTFVYGNGDTKTEGWSGPAFGRIAAGKMAVRSSAFDTNTEKDWSLSVAGRSSETITSSGMYDSVVTPFVFPDSKGDPVFFALEKASEEVLISMYVMDHREIVSLLMMLLEKGVSVTVLLEGSPAGGVPESEIRYMAALQEKGADVYFLKTGGVYKRYDLVHTKYAVVDSKTVIATSENWRESSFTNNRGWGAVIESAEHAGYMRNVFMQDCDPSKHDVHPLNSIYPQTSPITVAQYKPRPPSYYESFGASVKPVISPDFSFDYLKREILNASERVYAEQMSVQYAWTDMTLQSPLSWSKTAAGNGADVKIIADVTFNSESDAASNYVTVSIINEIDGMQAKTINGGDSFGLTHNKGVIIDDTVWVSSINWTNAAFMNNREFAAVIQSKEVADHFAWFFMLDWGGDETVSLTVTVKGNIAGEAIVLDASSSVYPKGTSFGWDLDGDGTVDRTGVKIAAAFPEGTHNCTLIASYGGSSYIHEFTVAVVPDDNSGFSLEPYIKYAPIIAIMFALLAASMIAKRRRAGR